MHHSCGNLTLPRPFLAYHHRPIPLSSSLPSPSYSRVYCTVVSVRAKSKGRGEPIKATRKENVWSIDNERAAAAEEKRRSRLRRRREGRGRGGKSRDNSKRGIQDDSRVLVSGSMLMEIETVLQTHEPVIRPAWDTFASSISGIWKGVGAVFSPFTAKMEPIGVGPNRENLYDCYTLSCVEKLNKDSSSNRVLEIRRRTNWVTLNPFGEGGAAHTGTADMARSGAAVLPAYESFDLKKSEVLEEESLVSDPGLVFFEDGSYSRGPVEILVGEYDESKYFLSPTFKFEQCLVKGCHKRLRIVHTIEFNEGGASIQIIRVSVFEEQWVSPANLDLADEMKFELKPFSQRMRTHPSELTGSWKVFEVSATPIFAEIEEQGLCDSSGSPFVYVCTEALKKRSIPDSSLLFAEEEMQDLQDVTILWLPGGVTGYVDVDKEGVLCIGVGWYSDEGINLVMERDYGTDGKLREVRWKSEVKRRWNDPSIV